MDIPSIKTFLIVANKQSFSVAAEKLFLTQPAISKRIAALENELNHKLFDRIRKKVILTQAGKLFVPTAQRIIDELEAGKNSLAEINGIVCGELLIATSHHIGLHHLPPVLKHYVSQYPQVDLKLDFINSEAACQAVESAKIELAIITLPNKPSSCLTIRKIWSDPLSIAVHNKHPILKSNKGTKLNTRLELEDLQSLSKFPAIFPGKGTYTREQLDKCFSDLGIELQIKLSNNYLETIKMMVSVGLGWSVLPATLIDDSLTGINVSGFSVNRSLGIVTHKDRTLSQAAQKMVDLISLISR